MMKKPNFKSFALLLFLGSICVGFSACSSDNDDDDYGTGPLAGRWEAHRTHTSSEGDKSEGLFTFTFKNGNVTYVEKWSSSGEEDDIETYTGPYTVENDIISMSLTRLRDDGTSWYSNAYVFKFEINGKKLTLTANDGSTRKYWGATPMTYTKK
ncbi:MAG: hypothetical protein II934_09080 [Prevotella sp.]|nr:hypothetical protein [Prevotella sp.]